MDSAYNTISYTFQTFADKMMGVASFIMPLLVATSALGSLSCHIMTSSRLCFVGARQGHFPDCLSLITIDKNLPKPSLIFLVSSYCQYYMYSNDPILWSPFERKGIKKIIKSFFSGNSLYNISICRWHLCPDQLCFICGIELYPSFRTGLTLLAMEKTWNESSNKGKRILNRNEYSSKII